MNTSRNNFLNDLIQSIGFLASFGISFFQYALNESFSFLFTENENILKTTSLVTCGICLAIILGVFTFRFSLLNKIYFRPKKKQAWLQYLTLLDHSRKNPNDKQAASNVMQNIEVEPSNFNILQLGFVFVFLALISFILLVASTQLWMIVLFYSLFICLTVTTITIFSVQLYRDREIKERATLNDELIMNKIRENFTAGITITYDSTDMNQFNINIPNRQIIFEYKGEKYQVFTRSDNPEVYFNMVKMDRN